LFIGDGHDAYMAMFGQHAFYAFYMHLCILAAIAMAQVHAELKHGESILEYFFSETGCHLPFFFGLGGKVIEHNDPQDAILI
jgi:hypothetical protein